MPLNDAALEVLKRRNGNHPTHVFTYEGNPIVQVNTKARRNALLRAGIRDFRWDGLRHTFATWHREAGTPTHELQRLGGAGKHNLWWSAMHTLRWKDCDSRLDSFIQTPRTDFSSKR